MSAVTEGVKNEINAPSSSDTDPIDAVFVIGTGSGHKNEELRLWR